MDDTTETWWTRLKASLRGTLRPSSRGLTDLEYRLRNERDDLRTDVARLNLELEDLRTENRLLASSLRVAQDEVAKLAEVVVRDRLRVQAETAAFAAKVADVDRPDAR
jgi:hypothetical protein